MKNGDERLQYHPALVAAFLIEDQGLEVDWDAVYKALEEFPPETIDRWRTEYRTGKRINS